eukprot:TRINITY_DN2145_c0_g1_i16.p1 TRINITY_DN2145_c0_g1~~TRINITY_DN2145_c0_g1_i16.p1  ORF type:complete len:124 (+),score=42.32 TRINITY_DN2145_c0_g1_i16:650-1021(+)
MQLACKVVALLREYLNTVEVENFEMEIEMEGEEGNVKFKGELNKWAKFIVEGNLKYCRLWEFPMLEENINPDPRWTMENVSVSLFVDEKDRQKYTAENATGDLSEIHLDLKQANVVERIHQEA